MNSLIKFLILNKVEKLEDFIIEKMVLKNNLLNDIDIDENQFRLLLPFLKIKNYDLDSFFDNCLIFKNQKICEIFHCENIHINQLKLDFNNESKIHNLCKSSDNYGFIKFLYSNFKYLFEYKNMQGNTAIDVALSEYKNIFENPNKNLNFEKINEKINEIELLIGDLNELEYDTTKYMNYISNIKKILSF